MARQRLVCTSCDTKISAQSFCPRCGNPTEQASAQERILWEMGQWEGSRERVVPQKPARIVLTPSSPQVVERMARPAPRPAIARPAAAAGNAVNGSSAMAMPIEQLDLRHRPNGSRPQDQRPAPAVPPQRRTTPPVPQARVAAPARPEAPVRTEPARPQAPAPRPPARRETPAYGEPPVQRPPLPRPPVPRPRPAGPPAQTTQTVRPPIPRPRPATRPAQPTPTAPPPTEDEPVEAAVAEPVEFTLAEPVSIETEPGVVRTRAPAEIAVEPLPTSVGAAQELRDAVAAPGTARPRVSRRQRRAARKEAARAARDAERQAKARAKAARKAGKREAKPAETAPVPPEKEIDDDVPRKLTRRERRVERLLDVIGAVEGEETTLILEGRSRLRSATLLVTQYRVSLLTRGANKRVIAWIPLEEIERIRRVWRGAPTAHIEGSFERLSFQAGTSAKLEEAIALIRREVREARAPGARRHHAEVIQLWCEHTSDVWESDTGRLRLWIRKHPIFTLAWLGSLVPIAYFGAHRL